MDLKLNFESEEELVEYLKVNLVLDYDSGYYGDGDLTVDLGSHRIASRYIPGGGCDCSCEDD